MKKFVLLLIMVGLTISYGQKAYPIKTIQQIQYSDSLIIADSLGIGSTRWLTQTSPFYKSSLALRRLVACTCYGADPSD